MLKIGITGGIGSGKTTVCKVFQMLGVSVFYADYEAKIILANNSKVQESLKEKFGHEVFFNDGTPNKNKLAEIIFNNNAALEFINSLIHPLVMLEFQKWSKQQTGTYVLLEAAILFESDAYKYTDKNITVIADEETRMRRIQIRDNTSYADIKKRMLAQMSDEAKAKLSDFIISNNSTDLLLPQILKIHHQISNTKEIF